MQHVKEVLLVSNSVGHFFRRSNGEVFCMVVGPYGAIVSLTSSYVEALIERAKELKEGWFEFHANSFSLTSLPTFAHGGYYTEPATPWIPGVYQIELIPNPWAFISRGDRRRIKLWELEKIAEAFRLLS